MRNLSQLAIGESAMIVQVKDMQLGCKLITMGFVPGNSVYIVRKTPFGHALYIKSGTHSIALRKSEAQNIEVS
jgi:Fe2+ transport system protein FeoA